MGIIFVVEKIGNYQWKISCNENLGCLYHCRATNQNVQKSFEDTICFKSYLVSKNSWIPKSNIYMLWMVASFTLVFQSASGPNLGYGSSNCQYIIFKQCVSSKPRVLVVVRWFYFNFHFVHCYEIWCGQCWSFESTTNM